MAGMKQEDLNEKLLEVSENGDLEKATKYLEEGAAVNCSDFRGRTPLHYAAIGGHLEIASLLIRTGADLETAEKTFGDTPLHNAAEGGHLDIVSLLIRTGAHLDTTDIGGETPLHYAARYGHLEIASLLIRTGADLDTADNYGYTPYDLARKWNHRDVMEYLKKEMDRQKSERESGASKDKSSNEDMIEQFRTMGNANDFNKLLKMGTFRLYNNCIYLCGACNVGKSALASILLGIHIPIVWISTDGLKIFYGRNGIDLLKKMMVPLQEGVAGHDIFGKVLRGNPTIQKPTTTEPESTIITKHRAPTLTAQYSPKKKENTDSIPPLPIPPAPVETSHDLHRPYQQTKTPKQTQQKPSKWSVVEKLDLQKLKIHDSILDTIRTGDYKMEIAPSDLVDFGGQRSYDMTHQLFIRQKGSFIVMVNGLYDMDDILPEYPKENRMTSRLIIKHWVESILTYSIGDDGDVMPVILFAATHSDHFTTEELAERQKNITKELTEMFSQHPQSQHIKYDTLFFINARDKADPEIKRMTSTVVEFAMKQRSWGQPVPMAWVPMDLQISQLKNDKVNIVTKQILIDLNTQNDDLALTDLELERFLQAQHSMGKIMYFQGHGLEEFVIIQPTALVNILRAFITDEMFWPEDIELRSIHQTLKTHGKISEDNLIKLWEQETFAKFIPDNDVRDYIIKILIHLDILIEPKPREGIKPNFYLVPCMVKSVSHTRALDDPTFEERAICLSYRLVKSTVPVALGFKMVGAALGIWPFQEEDGRPLIFFNSAVLCIDEDNELRIDVDDEKILVYLINAISKHNISPDIAASIQECLTWVLKNAVSFYHSCMGKSVKAVEIEDMIEIEVGGICQKNVCLLKLKEVEKKSTWTCDRLVHHNMKYPRFWVFDKTVRQEECPRSCTGLTEEELSQHATDKHLVRLASKVGIYSFGEFMIHLELTKAEWEEAEYMYKQNGIMGIKFMALHKWKGKKEGPASLKELREALKGIGDNRHHLCQIFREGTELLGVPYTIPEDEDLKELSRNIGNCAFHLGIELGLSVSQVEHSIGLSKDIFEQTYDVLQKWKNNSKANTLNILMKTLKRVRPEGVQFLLKKYNITIDYKKEKESIVKLQGGESTPDADSMSLERRRYEAEGAIPKQRRQQSQTDSSGKFRSKGVDRKKEQETSDRRASEQSTL